MTGDHNEDIIRGRGICQLGYALNESEVEIYSHLIM